MKVYTMAALYIYDQASGKYTEAFKWTIGVCLTMWLGLRGAYQALVILMAFDFIFGLFAHAKRKDLDLDKARAGFTKKILMLSLVWGLHHASDSLMNHLEAPLDFQPAVVLAGGFLITELKSLLIHCAALEIIIPDYVIRWLTTRIQVLQPRQQEQQKAAGEGLDDFWPRR